MAIHALLQTKLGKSVKDASDREIYEALLTVVKELAEKTVRRRKRIQGKRRFTMYPPNS